jgi:hypothetical protein
VSKKRTETSAWRHIGFCRYKGERIERDEVKCENNIEIVGEPWNLYGRPELAWSGFYQHRTWCMSCHALMCTPDTEPCWESIYQKKTPKSGWFDAPLTGDQRVYFGKVGGEQSQPRQAQDVSTSLSSCSRNDLFTL